MLKYVLGTKGNEVSQSALASQSPRTSRAREEVNGLGELHDVLTQDGGIDDYQERRKRTPCWVPSKAIDVAYRPVKCLSKQCAPNQS